MQIWLSILMWGFFGHKLINGYAIYLLPPQMILFYKPNVGYLIEHSVDPDKRRYMVKEEGPRHYLDLDHYGKYPYDSLPKNWYAAVEKFGVDSLQAHGVVPWWIQSMLVRLTNAFKEKDRGKILKLSAEIGHYIADAHVPLHASSNHNGQKTEQKGIHGFWESRIPELLAEERWDFFIGKAQYISDPGQYIWKRVLESGLAADTVLRFEKELSNRYPGDKKYAFENRNGVLVRQYSRDYTIAYDALMKGMVERRMRQAIFAIASFWFTAWVNAGQPLMEQLLKKEMNDEDRKDMEELNKQWKLKGGNSEHE